MDIGDYEREDIYGYFLRKTYLLMGWEIWIPSSDSYRGIPGLFWIVLHFIMDDKHFWKVTMKIFTWTFCLNSSEILPESCSCRNSSNFHSPCKIHNWVLLESFLTQYPPFSLVKDCNLDGLKPAISALTLNIAHWAEWKTWPSAKVLKTVGWNQKKWSRTGNWGYTGFKNIFTLSI